MLNIERRHHVDVRGQQFLYVLVTFTVLAAGNIRMRQFIHQHDLRAPRQNGIQVHFFKKSALVFQLQPRHAGNLRN